MYMLILYWTRLDRLSLISGEVHDNGQSVQKT